MEFKPLVLVVLCLALLVVAQATTESNNGTAGGR